MSQQSSCGNERYGRAVFLASIDVVILFSCSLSRSYFVPQQIYQKVMCSFNRGLQKDVCQRLAAIGRGNRMNIEETIRNTNEENESKIDWTNAWSKKYQVLATYQQKVNVSKYSSIIRQMLDSLANDYGYSELDSMLVLKDILYHEWKDKKQ